MKVYFKTYVDDNGIYFKNTDQKILIRFAGNPQFLLEECIKTFGNKEWIEFYDKLSDLFLNISKKGFSPIVAYLYNNSKDNANKQTIRETVERTRKKIDRYTKRWGSKDSKDRK